MALSEDEVVGLRDAVRRAYDGNSRVLWFDVDGGVHEVVSIPLTPEDPDDTGTVDWIARLGSGGHVDLGNVEAESFHISEPLFAPEPASVPRP